jgi:transcriptional regulator with XRE-family HTH domain
MTANDWANVARWLIRARGDRTQPEVARAADVSLGTIQKYESGRAVQGGRMLRKLATHYGWTPDSLDNVLAGGEPTYSPLAQEVARQIYTPAQKLALIEVMESAPGISRVAKERARKVIEGMPEA